MSRKTLAEAEWRAGFELSSFPAGAGISDRASLSDALRMTARLVFGCIEEKIA